MSKELPVVVEYRISEIGHISCARGACLLGRPAAGCRVPHPDLLLGSQRLPGACQSAARRSLA
jgi:hypothetical protein